LFQYIEFLRIQLTSRSISDYENALPSMELMWEQCRNDPAIVFQVWRPVLSASVRPALKIGVDGEVIIDENLASATLPVSTESANLASATLPVSTESAQPAAVEETGSTDMTSQQCNEQVGSGISTCIHAHIADYLFL
jgi:hypothetical protein